MITVIELSTSDRLNETRSLFEKIKPYLDQGYTYHKALVKVGKINEKRRLNCRNGWFRELIEYGKTQGYNYYDFKYLDSTKIGVKRVKAWDYGGLYL